MVKTQVQIPDELFARAKKVAAQKEWSFAEIVRRGLEQMVLRHPEGSSSPPNDWKLPDAVDLGLDADPFADPNWREELNLGSGATHLVAEQSPARAAPRKTES